MDWKNIFLRSYLDKKNIRYFLLAVLLAVILMFLILTVSALFQPRWKTPSYKGLSEKEILESRLRGAYQEVSAGLTPRNPLYVFDTLGEWIWLHVFTFSKEKRAERTFLISQEKIAEIIILNSSEKPKGREISQASREYSRAIQFLFVQFENLRQDEAPFLDDLATRISENVDKYSQKFSDYLPPDVHANLMVTLGLAQNIIASLNPAPGTPEFYETQDELSESGLEAEQNARLLPEEIYLPPDWMEIVPETPSP